MKKISYATGAYFGNRNVSHPKYKEDYTWYVQKHIEFINKQSVPIHKIYIVCTFEDSFDKQSILKKLKEFTTDSRVIIVERENLGAVYCSWKEALHIDNGESDYIILTEDDYILYDTDAVKLMLEYFNEEVFYLCQLWNPKPYQSLEEVIPGHAALASGMIDNKIYHKLRIEKGIDFKLRYGTGYSIYCANQAEFLEYYRRLGLKMIDWTKEYSTYYPHSDIEYGNASGKKLIVPIDRDLGYF
jgi:hypothetical protein